MKIEILKCPKCGSYGLQKQCNCGAERITVKPPRYSPEDKYGHYRRIAKLEKLKNGMEDKKI